RRPFARGTTPARLPRARRGDERPDPRPGAQDVHARGVGEGSIEVKMDDTLRDRIKNTVEGSKVVLFMKGTKNFPQCGFSAKVVGILKEEGVGYRDVNTLSDQDLRAGLKEYSNWPTFPQLYVGGKLVGGCDIVSSLHETGELAAVLGK